jgi:hypothetical protein
MEGAGGDRRCRSRLTPVGRLDELVWADLCEVIRESRPIALEYERRREIEAKAEAFAGQERELVQQVWRRHELASMVNGVEGYCRRVSIGLAGASFEQKRRLVELLIDRVIVIEGEVEMRYVIPTSRSGEHARFCHLRTNYLPTDAQKNNSRLEMATFERGLILFQGHASERMLDEPDGRVICVAHQHG